MTARDSDSGAKNSAKSGTRETRLAEQLRANLARRKNQKRGRIVQQDETAPSDPPESKHTRSGAEDSKP